MADDTSNRGLGSNKMSAAKKREIQSAGGRASRGGAAGRTAAAKRGGERSRGSRRQS